LRPKATKCGQLTTAVVSYTVAVKRRNY